MASYQRAMGNATTGLSPPAPHRSCRGIMVALVHPLPSSPNRRLASFLSSLLPLFFPAFCRLQIWEARALGVVDWTSLTLMVGQWPKPTRREPQTLKRQASTGEASCHAPRSIRLEKRTSSTTAEHSCRHSLSPDFGRPRTAVAGKFACVPCHALFPSRRAFLAACIASSCCRPRLGLRPLCSSLDSACGTGRYRTVDRWRAPSFSSSCTKFISQQLTWAHLACSPTHPPHLIFLPPPRTPLHVGAPTLPCRWGQADVRLLLTPPSWLHPAWTSCPRISQKSDHYRGCGVGVADRVQTRQASGSLDDNGHPSTLPLLTSSVHHHHVDEACVCVQVGHPTEKRGSRAVAYAVVGLVERMRPLPAHIALSSDWLPDHKICGAPAGRAEYAPF
jgi:hypothetical protein